MKHRWIRSAAESKRDQTILIYVLTNDEEKNILLSYLLLDACV